MNKIQYLRSRIKDLEKCISDPSIPQELRKNQAHALLIFKLDLERALNENQSSL